MFNMTPVLYIVLDLKLDQETWLCRTQLEDIVMHFQSFPANPAISSKKLKQTEMNRNGKKWTEIEQKWRESNRIKQKQTDKNRN